MASLRDQFAHFYAPREEDVAAALRTGLVTPDTNVLLALYRFQSKARDELFSAFEKVGDRLWIPHQVGLEFHRNRLSVIAAQESFFGKTREELDSAANGYLSKLKAFSSRIALSPPEAQNLEAMIRAAHAAVLAQVSSAEQANEVHLDTRDSDEVLARLETLFASRVGEPMSPEELEAARKEGKRRVEAKIPPGYMDKDKADPSGDYILWKQLKQEAGKRRLTTVLITDDFKEDWVRREHGLTLGPRTELRQEMATEAGVPFLLMNTETFLIHAEQYLSISVSPETIDQAKELPNTLKIRRLHRAEAQMDSLIDDLAMRLMEIEPEIRKSSADIETAESFVAAAQAEGSGDKTLLLAEAQLAQARQRNMTLMAERANLTATLRKTMEGMARGSALREIQQKKDGTPPDIGSFDSK